MADILVVNSKIKELIKSEGCQTSGDVSQALSELVEKAVRKAINRAKANGRKTVRGHDV